YSLILQLPQWSTLFPYTTLFRSQILFLMIDAEKANAFGITSGVQQCAGKEIMDLTGIPKNKKYECYVAFISDDRMQLSDSVYWRSEEHTSELQSRENIVCRLLLE